MQQAQRAVDDALATAMYATRCAVSQTLGISPGALAFHRDMLVDLPTIADLLMIQQKRQVLIDESMRRQNLKRRDWNYAVGQEVLIKMIDPTKLQPRFHGPYIISRGYANGTVSVRRGPHRERVQSMSQARKARMSMPSDNSMFEIIC
eukprot:2407121-Ditylum_brightwellii.AAC.1